MEDTWWHWTADADKGTRLVSLVVGRRWTSQISLSGLKRVFLRFKCYLADLSVRFNIFCILLSIRNACFLALLMEMQSILILNVLVTSMSHLLICKTSGEKTEQFVEQEMKISEKNS